jgi:hypothetical protein
VECAEGRAQLEHVLAPYLETWAWKGTVAQFLALWFDAEKALDSDVLEMADELRRQGLPCFIASVEERLCARYLSDDMGLARRSGRAPQSLLLIDDTPACVENARAAGWQAVLFSSAPSLREELAKLPLARDASRARAGTLPRRHGAPARRPRCGARLGHAAARLEGRHQRSGWRRRDPDPFLRARVASQRSIWSPEARRSPWGKNVLSMPNAQRNSSSSAMQC